MAKDKMYGKALFFKGPGHISVDGEPIISGKLIKANSLTEEDAKKLIDADMVTDGIPELDSDKDSDVKKQVKNLSAKLKEESAKVSELEEQVKKLTSENEELRKVAGGA